MSGNTDLTAVSKKSRHRGPAASYTQAEHELVGTSRAPMPACEWAWASPSECRKFPEMQMNASPPSALAHTDVSIPNTDGRLAAKLWGDSKNPPIVALHGKYMCVCARENNNQ